MIRTYLLYLNVSFQLKASSIFELWSVLLLMNMLASSKCCLWICSPFSEFPYKEAEERNAFGGLSLDGFLSQVCIICHTIFPHPIIFLKKKINCKRLQLNSHVSSNCYTCIYSNIFVLYDVHYAYVNNFCHFSPVCLNFGENV